MIPQQRHLSPVYISHAQAPHDFALTIIGDPDAPPGDAQIHVVYPDSASAAWTEPEDGTPEEVSASRQLMASMCRGLAALVEALDARETTEAGGEP